MCLPHNHPGFSTTFYPSHLNYEVLTLTHPLNSLYTIMSALSTEFRLAPTRALHPVDKMPVDDSKETFVRLVWKKMTPESFRTIGEFETWFNNELLPSVVASLGGPRIGRMLIAATFKYGGVAHFMRWVIMKFTSVYNAEERAAKEAELVADIKSIRELMRNSEMPSPGTYEHRRTVTIANKSKGLVHGERNISMRSNVDCGQIWDAEQTQDADEKALNDRFIFIHKDDTKPADDDGAAAESTPFPV